MNSLSPNSPAHPQRRPGPEAYQSHVAQSLFISISGPQPLFVATVVAYKDCDRTGYRFLTSSLQTASSRCSVDSQARRSVEKQPPFQCNLDWVGAASDVLLLVNRSKSSGWISFNSFATHQNIRNLTYLISIHPPRCRDTTASSTRASTTHTLAMHFPRIWIRMLTTTYP